MMHGQTQIKFASKLFLCLK